MKKTNTIRALIGGAIALALLLAGCDIGLSTPDAAAQKSGANMGTGSVTLNISVPGLSQPATSAQTRTVYPTEILAEITYTVSVDSGQKQPVNGNSISLELTADEHTFTVTGSTTVDGLATEVAVGTKTVTINAGVNNPVTVILGPKTGDGLVGTFTYSIDLSGEDLVDLDTASLTVTPTTGGGTVPGGEVTLDVNDANDASIANLPAGTYYLSVAVNAKRGGEPNETDTAKFSNEVIHVYAGLTSTFTRTYTAADFVALAPVTESTLTFAAPVTGGTPGTTVTTTSEQYTVTSIAWKVTVGGTSFSGNFAGDTQYTAVVALTALPGYTFAGVGAGAFRFSGGSPTVTVNTAGADNEITVSFAFEATDTVITTENLTAAIGSNVYSTPLAGTAVDASVTLDVDTVIESVGITADAVDGGTFNEGDSQKFTITLTAATKYTFTGAEITAADVVAAVLDSSVFTPAAIDNSAAIDGTASSATTLVVTVTYTKPTTPKTASTATVTAGHDTLTVTATGGSLAEALNVYVKEDGTAVTITADGTASTDFVKATEVNQTGLVITVTLDPATATVTDGSALKSEGTVAVTLEVDAQATPVPSITAVTSFSPQGELAAKLGGDGYATVTGTTVTLAQNVTLIKNVDVPEGVTLDTGTNELETNTYTLTVAGTLSVAANGKLTVAGTLNVVTGAVVDVADDAAIEVSGIYKLGNNVTGTNNGTVTVTSGGMIHNKVNVKIGGTGTNVVEAGGTVYFSDTVLFVGDDAGAVFQLGENATFSFDNSGFELDGAVTLNTGNNDAKTIFDLNAGAQALTLTEGSTLTVKDGKTLAVTRYGDRSGPGVVGATGARIIVSGTLDVSGDSANSNFYDVAGTEIIAPQTGTAFNWSADAGGVGNEGWVKTGSLEVTIEFAHGDSILASYSDGEVIELPVEDTTVRFTVDSGSGYTDINWYLDGDDAAVEEDSNTYDFDTAVNSENRPYTLTVTAMKGNHLFSQTVKFTVEELAE